jgi:glutathione S-transferase
MDALVLISHHLCPYVQRAAIALAEKGIPHERVAIDLADKPEWFLALSPLGKVPLLRVGEETLFESAAICEYLEEAGPGPRLHPADPIARAKHRAWMEFASALLSDVAGLYAAPDAPAMEARRAAIAAKLARVEDALGDGPWFAGTDFSLVDAAFGPVFRYFDAFEGIAPFGFLEPLPKTRAWRARLADRPSVRAAVAPDYAQRLGAFLKARNSHLSSLMG